MVTPALRTTETRSTRPASTCRTPGTASPWRALRRGGRPPRCRRIRGSRSRSAASSSAATWMRPASASARSSRSTSAARRASPTSISGTPPMPTRSSRTRSSRCSRTSPPTARRGRARSGSPAFSSTAAWIGARRGAAAIAGSSAPKSPARTRPSPPPGRPPTPSTGCSRANAARRSPRPSIGWTAVSGPSSCCATTATARRAKSAS